MLNEELVDSGQREAKNKKGVMLDIIDYVIDPKDIPTAVIFGKFSPWTGPNGHGRMLTYAKSKGLKKFAIVMPKRDTSKGRDADMYNMEAKAMIAKKLAKYQGFDCEVKMIDFDNSIVTSFGGISARFISIVKAGIDRPVIVGGPDRMEEYGNFTIPFGTKIPKEIDREWQGFGKFEALYMTERGEQATSGTAVREAIREDNFKEYCKLSGVKSDSAGKKIWEMLQTLRIDN